MTTAQVVETSVTVNNNSPIQDYVHPDDGFKPFTKRRLLTNLWEEGQYHNLIASAKKKY